jgi:site-specific DNA-methyltransferase (adenine-specific)
MRFGAQPWSQATDWPLSFEEPTAGMRARAAHAGFYESAWGKDPRIQLRTIRELLDGKGVDYPHLTGSNVTHPGAQRSQESDAETLELFGGPAQGEDGS